MPLVRRVEVLERRTESDSRVTPPRSTTPDAQGDVGLARAGGGEAVAPVEGVDQEAVVGGAGPSGGVVGMRDGGGCGRRERNETAAWGRGHASLLWDSGRSGRQYNVTRVADGAINRVGCKGLGRPHGVLPCSRYPL